MWRGVGEVKYEKLDRKRNLLLKKMQLKYRLSRIKALNSFDFIFILPSKGFCHFSFKRRRCGFPFVLLIFFPDFFPPFDYFFPCFCCYCLGKIKGAMKGGRIYKFVSKRSPRNENENCKRWVEVNFSSFQRFKDRNVWLSFCEKSLFLLQNRRGGNLQLLCAFIV